MSKIIFLTFDEVIETKLNKIFKNINGTSYFCFLD